MFRLYLKLNGCNLSISSLIVLKFFWTNLLTGDGFLIAWYPVNSDSENKSFKLLITVVNRKNNKKYNIIIKDKNVLITLE